VAAPLVGFATVGLAMAAYPQFDSSKQYISELGGRGAPFPIIFNLGILLTGALAAVAGLAFAASIWVITRRWLAALMTGTCFAIGSAGLVISALYPWPDPRHLAINLGLGIQLAPLVLIVAFWRSDKLGRLRWFLIGSFAAMAVLTVITKHLVFKGLVNDANVGWWERGFAFVLVAWVAVAAIALERHIFLESRRSEAEALISSGS
jgi:glucan biosynthesis protein C